MKLLQQMYVIDFKTQVIIVNRHDLVFEGDSNKALDYLCENAPSLLEYEVQSVEVVNGKMKIIC